MRDWNQLYSSFKSELKPVSSSIISNLQIGIMESYKHGVALQKECIRQEQISKLISSSSSSTTLLEEECPLIEFYDEEVVDDDSEKEEKLHFYLDLIFSNDIHSKEELYHYLPSMKEEHSFYYLSRILYALAKEKKDYRFILDDFDGEDYKHILKEIEIIDQKISWIHEYMSFSSMLEESEELQKNSLVFLETASNKACVLSDLKSNDIPEESYSSFMKLFQCLKEGIFPGLRKLQTNLSLFEIKDGTSRVVFTRVYKNYYCILTAFVKKCLWEKELRINLQNREDAYSKQSSSIYSLLDENNTEYLERQKQFESQIFSLLNKEQKNIGGDVKCKK